MGGNYAKASDSDTAFTYNISLTAEVTGTINTYATYADSNYLELGQGGMITHQLTEQGVWLQESYITEIGLKGSLLDKRLYASLAWYTQEKINFNKIANALDSTTRLLDQPDLLFASGLRRLPWLHLRLVVLFRIRRGGSLVLLPRHPCRPFLRVRGLDVPHQRQQHLGGEIL